MLPVFGGPACSSSGTGTGTVPVGQYGEKKPKQTTPAPKFVPYTGTEICFNKIKGARVTIPVKVHSSMEELILFPLFDHYEYPLWIRWIWRKDETRRKKLYQYFGAWRWYVLCKFISMLMVEFRLWNYIYIFYILYTKCNGSDALKSSIPWGLTHSWSMLLYIIHYNATEGVGKSSLISTYVSRYFSDVVPGIMTNAVLPPSEADSKCITRIIDSQLGDQALISDIQSRNGGSEDSTGSLTSFMNTSKETSSSLSSSTPPAVTTSVRTDAIILVYDLNRIETFYRLESHWLPLIERCYDTEVRQNSFHQQIIHNILISVYIYKYI